MILTVPIIVLSKNMEEEATKQVVETLNKMVKMKWITINESIRIEAIALNILTDILKMPYYKLLKFMRSWLP